MFNKMLRHTLMSVLVIGLFASGFAFTLGRDLAFSDSHSHDREEG